MVGPIDTIGLFVKFGDNPISGLDFSLTEGVHFKLFVNLKNSAELFWNYTFQFPQVLNMFDFYLSFHGRINKFFVYSEIIVMILIYIIVKIILIPVIIQVKSLMKFKIKKN